MRFLSQEDQLSSCHVRAFVSRCRYVLVKAPRGVGGWGWGGAAVMDGSVAKEEHKRIGCGDYRTVRWRRGFFHCYVRTGPSAEDV